MKISDIPPFLPPPPSLPTPLFYQPLPFLWEKSEPSLFFENSNYVNVQTFVCFRPLPDKEL